MNRISEEEYSSCYEQGKLVFEGKKGKDAAIIFLSAGDGLAMNKKSARCYLEAYICMRKGMCYKMTIKNEACKYFLDHIYLENGKDALELALQSLQEHITCYSRQKHGNLMFLQQLHDIYVIEVSNR